jgi:hypothetical protein
LKVSYGNFKSETKRELVLILLKEGKTFREIQRRAHVDPDFIVKVKKEEFRDDYIFENPRARDSGMILLYVSNNYPKYIQSLILHLFSKKSTNYLRHQKV